MPQSMHVSEFLARDALVFDLQGTSKEEVLRALASSLSKSTAVRADEATIFRILDDRERIESTAFGDGVAVPHGRMSGLERVVAVLAISKAGVGFGSRDGQPTHVFFALLGPDQPAGLHLKALARISRLLKNPSFRQSLREASSQDALYERLLLEDARP